MPKRIRFYIVALAAVLAVAAACVGLQPKPAGASTTTCGSACTSLSVESDSGYYLEETSLGSNPPEDGDPAVPATVGMGPASTTNSAQDWVPVGEGPVNAGVSAGVVPAALEMQYGSQQLMEFQWAPLGVPSDLCLAGGTPTSYGATKVTTVPVTLDQCGITAATLFIVDQNNASNGYDDLINCGGIGTNTWSDSGSYWVESTTNAFAEPAVLAVTSTGKVELAPLSALNVGDVAQTQMWENFTAPDQSALRSVIAKSG